MTMPELSPDLLTTILFYTLIWIGFGVQHSLLASSWIKRVSSLPPPTYRKFYNLIATITLVPILYYSYPQIIPLFKSLVLYQSLETPITRLATALLLLALALLLLILAFSELGSEGVKGFLGLQEEPRTLSFKGPYKYCRHPIYTATFLAIMGALLLSPTDSAFISSVLVSLYLIIGSTLEERRLQAEFPQYKEYVKSVGKFFPWKPSHLKALKKPPPLPPAD